MLKTGDQGIKQIIELIDLTNLAEDCDDAAIDLLCSQTITEKGTVAAVCVWPKFIKRAQRQLGTNSHIKIATVINFPSGMESADTCCHAIDLAINNGAHEIDYVLPYQQFLSGDLDNVTSALKRIRTTVPNEVHLKIILETGELKTHEHIKAASELAIDHGAEFIKTSTGKVNINATLAAADTMLDVIANKNPDVGFKPAGGIRTVSDARMYLKLADDKLGSAWLTADHFRIGASGLLQDALAHTGADET